MLKLKQLYTSPELINPINFSTGLNLIFGEKDTSSQKTNGVGKSLCIEFINFALLKDKKDSRVSLIPPEVFPHETLICLDFTINSQEYTIKRSLKDYKQPIIIENRRTLTFEKLEDATKYLTGKLFSNSNVPHPNFRVMMGPLIRDERSEFKSIIACYNTENRVADDYTPHLYLFDIDIDIYKNIKKQLDEIKEIRAHRKRIKDNVKLLRQVEIKDARADLNELDDEVHSIEAEINKLENAQTYDIIKDEMLSLEHKIEEKRRTQAILKQKMLKLEPVSHKIEIEINEISKFYEQLKNGLGTLIEKDLEEVIQFKDNIDEFQNKLINDRRNTLSNELADVNNTLSKLDKNYTDNLKILDQKGNLKDLKQTYSAYVKKSDQSAQLRVFVDKYDELDQDRQKLNTEKEVNLLRLQSDIHDKKNIINDFQNTILNIHEYIQGNKQASFQIRQIDTVKVIDIDMRIADDGSHSVDREKVFIYDIALLLNKFTQERHPGFLIHDNIFEVDQDTFIKSIHYLKDKADFEETQYILTLNSDRLDMKDSDLFNSLEPYIKASFTKKERFLKGKKYAEIK